MSFQIPNRYRYPVILVSLLRDKLEEWTLKNIKREFLRQKIRDPELEELYFSIERDVQSSEEYCSLQPYKYILRVNGEINTISEGPEIIFDVDKNRVYVNTVDFYPIPKAVKDQITTIGKMLSKINVDLTEEEKEMWENESITDETLTEIEDIFALQIGIWTKKRVGPMVNYKEIFNGRKCYDRKVFIHLQEETGVMFYICNSEKYFENYFICSNRNKGCYYQFRNKKNLEDHERSCCKTALRIVQTEYGPTDVLIEKAQSHGLLPEMDYNRDFLFYDIESVLPKSNEGSAKTKVLSTHQLVSISANR